MRETQGERIASIRSGFSVSDKRTTCKDCDVLLTEENQYPSCRKRGQYCCKKCWNQRFYFAVKKGKYGISLNKLAKILESQGYKCAICDSHMTQAQACVDHCHTSGRIRGILCNTCNAGLGMLKDSMEILQKAIYYLDDRSDPTFDLRNIDFGESPTKPPLLMDKANIKRRAYIAANKENILRIDREWRARRKIKPDNPVKEKNDGTTL